MNWLKRLNGRRPKISKGARYLFAAAALSVFAAPASCANYLPNGDFSSGFDSWVEELTPAQGRSTALLSADSPYSNVVQLLGSPGTSGGVSNRTHDVSLNVQNYGALTLTAAVKAVSANVSSGCGALGREHPIQLVVFYTALAGGATESIRLSFYYGSGTFPAFTCGNPTPEADTVYVTYPVPQNTWYNYTSPDLRTLAPDAMGTIIKIQANAMGWNYDGRADNIVLKAAPAAVQNLNASAVSTGAIALSWAAPYGDGAGGMLYDSTFTIQYATYTSVAWSTSSAQINISTTGVNPWSPRSYTLNNLSGNTTYYFRLWTRDSAGDHSGLSNGATTSTLIDTPAGIYLDEVGANAIVASAYAPEFTGLDRPGSGVNIATDTYYGVWGSTGDAWNTKAGMGTFRQGAAAAVIGGKLYVVGGAINVNNFVTTNEEYDPAANVWITKTPMTTNRFLLAAGAVNGRLYAVGGYNTGSGVLRTNEEYDPVTNAVWTTRAPMPTARERLAAGVTGGKLYAIGGYNGGDKDNNEAYDPATNTWAIRKEMPGPRSKLAVGVIGGKLYAVGGESGMASDLNEEYDPVKDEWHPKRAMPTARSILVAGVIGGRLYAVGGNGYLDVNEAYDLAADTWTTKAAMLTAREGAAAGVINGKLYVAGGYNGGYLNTSEEYRPGVTETFTGLTPNTWYSFRAKARNQDGAETGEVYVSTYTMAVATTPASGQSISKVYISSVTVDWSSGTAAGGFNWYGASYKIMASTAPDFSGDIVSQYPIFAAPYTLESLSDNTTYYFRVQAYNAGGMTDHSWTLLGSTRTVKGPPPGVIISTMGAATGDFGKQRSMVRDSQGDLYLAYLKLYNGKKRVFLARSTDDGASWTDTTPTPIETAGDVPVMNSYDQESPALAIDSNDVLHLVWGGTNNVLDGADDEVGAKCVYSAAAVPGTSWSPYAQISVQDAFKGIEGEFNIAVDSKNGLHVAWSRQGTSDPGSYSVWYTSRASAGPWALNVPVSEDGKQADGPALAIDAADGAHIAAKHAAGFFTNTTPSIVYSSRSAASTLGAWSTIYSDGVVNQESPSLTITSAGSLMAVWNSSDAAHSNSQIKYSVKPEGGSWSAAAYAHATLQAPQRGPRVAADALGNVYMVWSGSDTLNPVVNIKASVYDGAAWSPWQNVSDGLQLQQYPRLRWAGWRNNGGGMDLIWNDYDGIFATATIRALHGSDSQMSPGWTAASWPKPEGCGYAIDVKKDGTASYTGIQAAVGALSADLSTTTCVVIRDALTYSEQVTVRGFKNNGYRLKIMSDPALAGAAPAVNPPNGSIAAFNIANTSVSVQGINIISTSPVNFGIYASSDSVNISSVNVASGGLISSAVMRLLNYSAVSYSSITAQSANGILIAGANNEVSFSTITNNYNYTTALFLSNSGFNSVTHSYISNPGGTAAGLSSGSDHNTISDSTIDSNTGAASLSIYNSDFNTVTRSYIRSLAGFGASLDTGSDYNTISYSTITNNSGNPAVYIIDSDSNTVAHAYVSNQSGNGVNLVNGADHNTISYSTVLSTADGYSALYVQGASYNTVTESHLSNPAGNGVYLFNSANHNTISYSTMTSDKMNWNSLFIYSASSNTVTHSYIYNSKGIGAKIYTFANYNEISDSTITSNGSGYAALYLVNADFNTVSRSDLSAPGGDGAYLWNSADFNTISDSTMTSGGQALYIVASGSNTVSGSYMQGENAAYISGSSATIIGGSTFVAANSAGHGLRLAGGSGSLALSSSTLTGGAQGAGIFLDENNIGVVNLSSNTITGGKYGLNIATQAGASLNVSNLIFNSLTQGATAINFLGGLFGSTFTGTAFISPNIAVNVNGSQLQGGSLVTMRGHAGLKTGPVFENDPSGYVDWPAIVSAKSGSWSEPSTWDYGIVPAYFSPVMIAAGHVVTVDIMNAVSSNTAIYGTVKASRATSSSWTLTGGDINVNAGGTLDYGTEASPIPAVYLAHLVLSSGTYAGQYGLIVNNGGNFTVQGAAKTPYSFATASIGGTETQLTVYGSTSTDGWQAGDVITIGPTSGNGTATTSSRIITSVDHNAGSNIVNWSGGGLGTPRTLSSTSPIIVANLTRNVLVKSSGTAAANHAYIQNLARNATSFALTHGEFAYLGTGIAGKEGIIFDGALTKGSISSSTVRNGHYGIYLNASSTNTLTGNTIYSNSSFGIFLNGPNNTLTGNNSGSNGYGIRINTNNSTLIGNNNYSSLNYGIYLNNGSLNNNLTGNNSYSNALSGIYLNTGASYTTLTGNNSYSNAGYGIWVEGFKHTLTGNNFYFNAGEGIHLMTSNNTLTGNNSYSNASYGIYFYYNSNNTLTGNNIYSNSHGLYFRDSSSNTFVGGSIGYNAAGNSLKNTTAEIYFYPGDPATPETLVLKGTRVNPAVGISTAGMNVPRASLISYNQDYDTGTVRMWGNYQVVGSTLTLDYTTQLYTSTATTPKLMRGTGHSAVVEATYDTYAVSQLITINYRSGAWHVDGSATGDDMRTFTGSQPSLNVPAGNAQFSMNFTEVGTPQEGDTVDFVLTAASNDAGRQKKLLFGYSAAGYNSGRSKLEIAADAGIVLKGNPDGTANTLIDMIAGNSTYYLFVDSGAFTASYSSFTNMGPGGIQVYGNKGFSLGYSNFDYFGFTDASSTNSYITARSLVANTTVYNTIFGLSRAPAANQPVWNVHVELADIVGGLYFRGIAADLGARWGEGYDDELGASNNVTWVDNACDPRTSTGGGGLWSAGATWDTGFAPTFCSSVTIRYGDVVTIDTLNAVSSNTVINGTVMASRAVSSSWTLTGGDINVNAGGTLDYGTEASPIPAVYLAHIVLSSGTYAGQYGLIVRNGGNFTVRGAAKAPYVFASANISGTGNTLSVSGFGALDGWKAGDEMTIGPTSGSGTASTSKRTVTGISGPGPYDVSWSASEPLGTDRTISSTSPIIVANLTRNVLVRSSGTVVVYSGGNSAYILNLAQNATSFSLAYGEFAYLGGYGSGNPGITFNSALTKGSISSSTIRNGLEGIDFEDSSFNTLTGNNIYSNTDRGIGLWGASNNNALNGNHVYSNPIGISFTAAHYNTLAGNYTCSNSNYGLFGGGSNNTLTGNNSYSNTHGIYLDFADNYTLTGNNAYSNAEHGIYLYGSNGSLTGNNSYSNANGFYLPGSNNTLTGNNSYSNSYGLYAWNSSGNTFVDGNIGFNSSGASLKSTTAEIYFLPGGTPETLTLKGTRVNPETGISTLGMNVAGASLISYNQDADTGTVRIWGDYQLTGSTLTLDYAGQVYYSNNTTPKLMRGMGHSIINVVTKGTATLSELITVTNTSGSLWDVVGSSSGLMGTFTCNIYSGYNFTSDKVNFTLTAGAAINAGDSLDFVTTASSNDAGRRKKLLFGPADFGFNTGRSRLLVDSSGGVVLRGKNDGTAHTLMDWLSPASTYYTFMSSGAFTAEFSSITNMDQNGIQLGGNQGVSISSSTFDSLGFAPGINTYLTMYSLISNATFYNVAFGLSRSSAGFATAYNVRVAGYEGNLAPVFRKTVPSLGPLWGERYDYDPANKVKWSADFPATPGCGAGLTVSQDENSDYTTIQAAVNALPVDLSTDTCVVIRDTQTYSEQVTVQGFNNNGYRLKIMADPAFVSSAPAVNPPYSSNAAFTILNASVSLQGINIISTNTAPFGIYSNALFLNISSVNVISGGNIWSAGVRISSYSAVAYSSITVQSAIGLYLTGSNNEVSFSSIANNVSGNYALFLIDSDSNTVTRSYISNPSGYSAVLSVGADHNTVSYSTMTSGSDSGMGLYLYGASSNTVSNSYILNSGGTGAISDFHSANNNIVFSTITGYGYAGLFVQDSLLTTVSNCYIQGSAVGAEVIGSTGTMIGGSVLVSTNTDGVSFAEWAGSLNLTLSSSTIIAATQGWGIWLGEDNTGAIDLSSNTLRGGEFGLNIATQTGGAVLSITSMTFQSLSAGATAFNFLGGQFVATFTAVAFNSADIAVNVNGSSLTFGSRITVHQAAGEKSGPDYEKDPGNYVDWDGVTVALLAPANGVISISQSPGLHARVLDAGGPVQYNYQLDTAETVDSQGTQPLHNFNQTMAQAFTGVGAFSGQDGTILTSGDSYLYNSTATLVFYSTGTSRLSPNTLYYWRVRAKTAETGYFGVWSATSSFITGEAAAALPVNNLAVTNVSLSSPTGLGVTVNFTIRENNVLNGTTPNGGAYNTADWIFIKFSTQAGADGTWNHATLAGGGFVSGGVLTVASDKKGAYVNHLQNSALWQANVSVVWNYAADGVTAANARIKVFAISMVKLPEGEFVYNAGNIGGSNSNNYGGGVQTPVTSAGSIPSGSAAGWPNGYNSFYLMRYELTQGQYADFLNAVHSSTAAARYYADNMTDTGSYPLKYAATDRFAAKSNLSTADAWSYLSWAALRPMTEMEFEKAGRDVGADTRKYPWGSTEPDTAVYSPRNEGWPHIRNFMNYNNVGGVLDSGRYASGDVYRTTEQTGISPWGIADLSGNLAEQVINCTYTPVPENGNGTAIWPNWPAVSSTQKGLRGGCWFRAASLAAVSVRGAPEISWSNSDRNGDVGVRGARTAAEQIIIPQ